MPGQTADVVITATLTVVCGAAAALLVTRGDRVAEWNNRNLPGTRAQAPTMKFVGWFLAAVTLVLLVTLVLQA
ncbi:MAG TPA: hypothetical protein VGL75_18950 [Acidothermaceae bacterium]